MTFKKTIQILDGSICRHCHYCMHNIIASRFYCNNSYYHQINPWLIAFCHIRWYINGIYCAMKQRANRGIRYILYSRSIFSTFEYWQWRWFKIYSYTWTWWEQPIMRANIIEINNGYYVDIEFTKNLLDLVLLKPKIHTNVSFVKLQDGIVRSKYSSLMVNIFYIKQGIIMK